MQCIRPGAIYNLHSRRLQLQKRTSAADVVGDGSSGIVGPFEAAQGQFIGGQVVPLVVGAFGEVIEKMLRTLAKLASSGEDSMSISPLRNLDKKGGAFAICIITSEEQLELLL